MIAKRPAVVGGTPPTYDSMHQAHRSSLRFEDEHDDEDDLVAASSRCASDPLPSRNRVLFEMQSE